MPVVERDLGYRKIMRELHKLEGMTVNVGVQSNESGDIIDKAFYNEYGTKNEDDTVRIPERSFIRSAFDENREDINTTIERVWKGVIQGKLNAKRAASIVGQRHQDQVKTKVRNGPFTPNADSTIASKGSSKPLIDTKEMVNSIRYEVD